MSPPCIIEGKYSYNSQKVYNLAVSVGLLPDAKKSRPAMLQNGILDAAAPYGLFSEKI